MKLKGQIRSSHSSLYLKKRLKVSQTVIGVDRGLNNLMAHNKRFRRSSFSAGWGLYKLLASLVPVEGVLKRVGALA